MSDLFAPRGNQKQFAPEARKSEPPAGAKASAGDHRCEICGAFAPFGLGLPHRGERVRYFCQEHKPK
jgi:hypothetical protein